MDYPKSIISNHKEDSISIQRVKELKQVLTLNLDGKYQITAPTIIPYRTPTMASMGPLIIDQARSPENRRGNQCITCTCNLTKVYVVELKEKTQ